MTVLQALAMGGGLSQRGTERGVRIHRRGEDGAVRVLTPQLNDLVQADDVIVVREAPDRTPTWASLNSWRQPGPGAGNSSWCGAAWCCWPWW